MPTIKACKNGHQYADYGNGFKSPCVRCLRDSKPLKPTKEQKPGKQTNLF